MKMNRLVIVCVIAVIAGGLWLVQRNQANGPRKGHEHSAGNEDVYWTCSMHPQVKQDKPGQCPICGMNLIAVRKSDQGKIIIEEDKAELLDIHSDKVEIRTLVKKVRLPGRIGHDMEFYTLQQEYLTAISILKSFKDTISPEMYGRQKDLADSAKLRLSLLGLTEDQITELESKEEPDKSLIEPAKGEIWAQADIYEQDLRFVKAGQKVIVTIRGYTSALEGVVYAVSDILNEMTRSATARIKLQNVETFIKHQRYAEIELENNIGERLCIPTSSVIDTGTRKVVYVDEGEGRYQLRQVQLGVEAQGYVEVKEGLERGEQVVSHGNFLLDSQTTLTGGQSLLYSGSNTVDEKPEQKPVHRH